MYVMDAFDFIFGSNRITKYRINEIKHLSNNNLSNKHMT